jgi:hypothetical protein
VAGPISLHDLIETIANAVIEAQSRIEQHQISNLARYFDQDDRPTSVPLRLPNTSPNAGPDETDRILLVPLLALVNTCQLKIKDVEVAFDVDLGEFSVPEDPPAAEQTADGSEAEGVNSAWHAAAPQKTLDVDMRQGVARDRDATARIVLRLEGQEPPEGLARLIHHLIKTL